MDTQICLDIYEKWILHFVHDDNSVRYQLLRLEDYFIEWVLYYAGGARGF